MQIRAWLDNLDEADVGEIKLRVILKGGNELEILWEAALDSYATPDELTNGNYMIDTRSIAAVEYIGD